MADIFVSYASADRDKARAIADILTRLGFSVWWDRTIAPGEVFDEVLQRALDEAKCVLVLWSNQAVSSNWVKTEAAEAAARNILVPALIEPARLPIEFKRIQCADLTRWDSDANDPEFASLLASVRRLLARPASAGAATAASSSLPDAPSPNTAARARSRSAVVAWALGGLAVALTTAFVLMRSAQSERIEPKAAMPTEATPANRAMAPDPQPAAAPEQPPKAAEKPEPSRAAAAAPSAVPASPAKPARINLLADESGGHLVVAADPIWKKSITQYEDQQGWAAFGEAVYAFKDEREAVFDTFSVMIVRTHEANLKEFMLLASSDSPTGRFEPIGRFSVQNVGMMGSPYQDFSFAPVKAKYLKVKLINTQGGRSGGAVLHKFKLTGSLQ